MNYKYKLSKMLELFKDLISSEQFQELIKQLNDSQQLPKFIFAGVGKNWYICEKVVKTFISMGIHAEALDCTHALHGDLGMLSSLHYVNEPKMLFFVSKSGTTEELIKLAKIVRLLQDSKKLTNLTTVSFSLNPKKPHEELFDIMLTPSAEYINRTMYEFDTRNLVPSLSINIMQMVLDVLGNELYEARPLLIENYVYNHLGGSNGKKLGGDKFIDKVTD